MSTRTLVQVTGPARERLKTERQCESGVFGSWRVALSLSLHHVSPCRPELATDLKAMMAALNDVWEQVGSRCVIAFT